MSIIRFHLNHTSTLAGMAPPPAVGGGFGPAALPPGLGGQGVYVINNTHTNNRYAGISTNLANRFASRMSVITECGFAGAHMAGILIWWGQILTQQTPIVGAPLPPLVPFPGYAAPLTVVIDGSLVNAEQLLIRYLINRIEAGGTVSNNLYAGHTYANPTPNPVTVQFHSAGNAVFPPFNDVQVWAPGGAGW